MRSSSLSSERTSYKSVGFRGNGGHRKLQTLRQYGKAAYSSGRFAQGHEKSSMRVPVLAYHAVNIAGNDYANNDHVAFAADLRMIDDLGLRVVPLHWVVEHIVGHGQSRSEPLRRADLRRWLGFRLLSI